MPLTLLLHGQHEGPTVRYEPFGPWLVPWRYTTFEAEYTALRQGQALSDVSLYALLEVQGRDRLSFLHNLLSQDVKRLQPGDGARTALLDPVAKMLGDLVVLVLPETCWLLCPLDQAPTIRSTLDKYLFSEDVRLINRERPYAALALHGPTAARAPYSHRETSIEGLLVREVSFSPFGIHGLLYLVEAGRAVLLWEALRARPAVQPVGWEALNAARLEAGMPWYGLDIDATHLLPETGLETLLASDSKGCYPGQEIVARMATYGSANKKLMLLLAEDDKPLEPGSELRREGGSVGRVTSAGYAPARQRWLAFGYVKRGCYEPGTMLGLPDGRAVTVLDRPVINPASSGRTLAGG